MTVKEYLQQATHVDAEINSKLQEITKLRGNLDNIKAQDYTSDRVNASCNNSANYTTTIDKIIDLENEINREIDTLIDLKIEIRRVIERVSNCDERIVLRDRYISMLSWDAIATERNYSVRQILRIHGSALNSIRKMSLDVIECHTL